MRDRAIEIDGGSFNVWLREPTGSAPWHVLVHGLTSNSRWWGLVIAHLPADVGLVVPDLRGRGNSADAPPPFDLKTLAGDLIGAADQLGIAMATFAGYSMGAWVTALTAQRHAERVTRLVLVDGGFPIEVDGTDDPEAAIEVVVGPAVTSLETIYESRSDHVESWRSHPAMSGRWDPRLDQLLNYGLEPADSGWRKKASSEAVARGGSDLLFDEAANEAARTSKVPTTVVLAGRGMLGQPGGFMDEATVKDAATANPNLELELLADQNHYSLLLAGGAEVVARALIG